jgi:hypothetical protein
LRITDLSLDVRYAMKLNLYPEEQTGYAIKVTKHSTFFVGNTYIKKGGKYKRKIIAYMKPNRDEHIDSRGWIIYIQEPHQPKTKKAKAELKAQPELRCSSARSFKCWARATI